MVQEGGGVLGETPCAVPNVLRAALGAGVGTQWKRDFHKSGQVP